MTAARGVRVCDRLPAGLVLVKARGTRLHRGWACWRIERLGRGKARTFGLTARATATSRVRAITNRVVVRAANARTRRDAAGVQVWPAAGPPGGVTG